MRKKKRSKQDIKHLKTSIRIWFSVLIPASFLAYLAEKYVFQEYVYKFGKDAVLCDPNETDIQRKRYCDNLGERITGKMKIGNGNDYSLFLLDEGRMEHEWIYRNNTLAQEDDMGWMRDGGRRHNLKGYWPGGGLKYHVSKDGIFEAERTYDEAGGLVSEWFQASVEIGSVQQTIYHKTNLGYAVSEDRAYPVGGSVFRRIDSFERISGYFEALDNRGESWLSVELKYGEPI